MKFPYHKKHCVLFFSDDYSYRTALNMDRQVRHMELFHACGPACQVASLINIELGKPCPTIFGATFSWKNTGVRIKELEPFVKLAAIYRTCFQTCARTGFLEALNSKVTSAMYLSQTQNKPWVIRSFPDHCYPLALTLTLDQSSPGVFFCILVGAACSHLAGSG